MLNESFIELLFLINISAVECLFKHVFQSVLFFEKQPSENSNCYESKIKQGTQFVNSIFDLIQINVFYNNKFVNPNLDFEGPSGILTFSKVTHFMNNCSRIYFNIFPSNISILASSNSFILCTFVQIKISHENFILNCFLFVSDNGHSLSLSELKSIHFLDIDITDISSNVLKPYLNPQYEIFVRKFVIVVKRYYSDKCLKTCIKEKCYTKLIILNSNPNIFKCIIQSEAVNFPRCFGNLKLALDSYYNSQKCPTSFMKM